jgi:hypothetical protein
MNNLLTISDFIDDVQINGSAISSVSTAFTNFIAKMQAEFLRKVLGEVLYAEYVAGMSVVPVDAIWTKLTTGAIYDTDYYFEGLKEALKYYIYVKHQQNTASINVNAGNVSKKSDVSTVVSINPKTINAQYKCMDICDRLKSFCDSDSSYSNLMFSYPFLTKPNIFLI